MQKNETMTKLPHGYYGDPKLFKGTVPQKLRGDEDTIPLGGSVRTITPWVPTIFFVKGSLRNLLKNIHHTGT